MASAVDSRLAYARLSAVATASRLPTATRGSNNSYTTSWDTTPVSYKMIQAMLGLGHSHSRAGHPSPGVREDAMVHAMLDAARALKEAN